MIAGAIASGRVPMEGGDVWRSWTGPTSWVGGVAGRADVLVPGRDVPGRRCPARRQRRPGDWIGRRAFVCGIVTGIVAVAAIVPIELDSDTLAGKLQGRGAVLLVVSASAGLAALWLLHRRRWATARVGAVIAVAAIVVGWGVAQYPDLLTDTMTLDDAAGARPTLVGLRDHVRIRRGDRSAGDDLAVRPGQPPRLGHRRARLTRLLTSSVDAAPYSAPIRPRAGRLRSDRGPHASRVASRPPRAASGGRRCGGNRDRLRCADRGRCGTADTRAGDRSRVGDRAGGPGVRRRAAPLGSRPHSDSRRV